MKKQNNFKKGPLSYRRESKLWTEPHLNPKKGVSVKPLQATARRRAAVWRIVGVKVGLPRHNMEVEGVVVIRFWNSESVVAHAMLRRMSQKDEATIMFHEYFNADCCDMRNLSAPFPRP